MRFYLNEEFTPNQQVLLQKTEHHHLSHVLRLKEKEQVLLVNGRGSLAHASVLAIHKEQTRVQIHDVQTSERDPVPIAMAIPIMRPAKLEWVVEKLTELGADEIYIFKATLSKPSHLSEHQIERLRAITISALKQSQRLFLPEIEILSDLSSLLSKEKELLFCNPCAEEKIALQKPLPSMIISGPESGFSKEELALLASKARGVKLSGNVLRAETAPIAALSIIEAEKLSL